MPLAPPPATSQDINSRQFRDWFYSIYALLGQPGQTLGTMAYENANSVAITGGAIGGVGISGSTINSTPIGVTGAASGKFTTLEVTSSLKTDTLTGYLYGNGSGSNVSASTTIPSGSISGLGTMATQNANSVAITGGNIDGTIVGATTPSRVNTNALKTTGLTGYLYGNDNTGDVTSSTTVPWSDVSLQPYIEAVDTSSTITLTTTPQLLKPTTVVSNSGITYNSSTGVFTFTNAGSYNQVITVNALASSANQYVYIYAENWNGSTWVVNTNSGKQQILINNNITQVVLPNAVKRTAGQQVRYFIYSNGSNVTLQTSTLPGGVGAIVPTIRIQYS